MAEQSTVTPNKYKILGSTVISLLLKGALFAACFFVSDDSKAIAVNISILVAGLALGWLIAVLATPYDTREEKWFSSYKQTISAFIGGYLLSKVDTTIATILSWENLSNLESGFRVVAFCSGCLLSIIVTYVYRVYANPTS